MKHSLLGIAVFAMCCGSLSAEILTLTANRDTGMLELPGYEVENFGINDTWESEPSAGLTTAPSSDLI